MSCFVISLIGNHLSIHSPIFFISAFWIWQQYGQQQQQSWIWRNAYESMSTEEEEEGGLIVEGDAVDEGKETKIDFR